MHQLRIWLWVVIVFSASILQAQEEYRTWISKNGAHKLEAAFVKAENGTVSLKKRDGETIEVKLSGLSEADNAYVKTISGEPIVAEVGEPRVDDAPTKTRPIISGAKELKLEEGDFWNVQPDPYVSSVRVETSTVDPGMTHVMEGMLLSPDRSTMFAFYQNRKLKPVVQKIDLLTGEMIGTALEIPKSHALDVTPDKKVFMAISKQGIPPRPVLNIVHYGEALHSIASFSPYGKNGKLEYAQFVGDDHFLTVSSDGLLGLWNIKTLKLRWNTTVSARPALSPNRKLLFLHVGGTHLAVLDALTGEVKGMRPAQLTGVSQLCVNDACTKLVGVGMGTCRQWDLATGELVADFSISGTLRNCQALFVNDDQVLVAEGNRFIDHPTSLYDLVDLNLQCSMWVYGLTTPPVVGLDGKVWVASQRTYDDPAPELACVEIPHPEAAAAIQSTSFEDVSRFEPGGQLPIRIDYNAPNWNRENVESSAKRFVGAAGFELALEQSDPGFEVSLTNPKIVRDGRTNFVEDVSLVDVLFFWEGQAIWRPSRTMEFYQQQKGKDPVSIFDDPWIGLVFPRAFRFYKPVLDGSYPAANGNGPPSFEPLTYYRSYDDGFAFGMNGQKGQAPTQPSRPPLRPGGLPGRGR